MLVRFIRATLIIIDMNQIALLFEGSSYALPVIIKIVLGMYSLELEVCIPGKKDELVELTAVESERCDFA
jgi:hypothetical protein